MTEFLKFDGGPALKAFFQLLSKQGKRMTSKAKTQACVVGDKVLRLGWDGQ